MKIITVSPFWEVKIEFNLKSQRKDMKDNIKMKTDEPLNKI